MANASIWRRRAAELLDVYISGMDRVEDLLAAGRVEDARDHLIGCARAVWQYRWATPRVYSLRRLGEALDAARYPALAPVVAALQAEQADAAAQFVAYVRTKVAATPALQSFVAAPAAPPAGFDPTAQTSFALWRAWAATRDPATKAQLDQRIAAYLDPHVVITWHESAGPWAHLVLSATVHGGLDDATLCRLILFGLDHAEHCNVTAHLADPPQTSIGGNHLFAWIMAWFQFVLLFPEFRRTPALQAAALARLDDELSKQVMPDGSMIEGVPGYQNCCLFGASEFLRLAATFGVPLPERARADWEQMLRFNIGLMRPDFCVPFLGDSHDQHVPGYVWQLRRFYDFPELTWTVSSGREGRPPAFTSRAFPRIGYFVQRSGWTPDALYLCFDGGRFGQAHHHEDKLHVELSAYGRQFLVDVGDHSYTDHWMRRWAVLSQAHNTLLVDGLGQCRWREDRDRWYGHTPVPARWVSGDTWDVAEADFAGPFERPLGNVRVRRRVVFHKGTPPFWWVTDWAEGEGMHEVTELFHFAHDLADVAEVASGVRTRQPSGPDLAVLSLAGAPGGDAAPRVTRHRGEREPTRGWVAPQLYTVEPAWEVHFSGAAALPLRRDFLLLPWRTALPDDVTAALHPAGLRLTLALRVGPDTWQLALPEG